MSIDLVACIDDYSVRSIARDHGYLVGKRQDKINEADYFLDFIDCQFPATELSLINERITTEHIEHQNIEEVIHELGRATDSLEDGFRKVLGEERS